MQDDSRRSVDTPARPSSAASTHMVPTRQKKKGFEGHQETRHLRFVRHAPEAPRTHRHPDESAARHEVSSVAYSLVDTKSREVLALGLSRRQTRHKEPQPATFLLAATSAFLLTAKPALP